MFLLNKPYLNSTKQSELTLSIGMPISSVSKVLFSEEESVADCPRCLPTWLGRRQGDCATETRHHVIPIYSTQTDLARLTLHLAGWLFAKTLCTRRVWSYTGTTTPYLQ